MRIHKTSFVLGLLVVPVVLICLTLVFAGTASVPHAFAPNTPALSSEVNANFAALRDAINANVPKRTLINYSQNHSLSTAAAQTYEKMAVIGSFDKVAADTDILLLWNSDLLHNNANASFQLRVDDTEALGLAAAIVTASGYSLANTPFLFQGLAPGSHEVSVWVKSFNQGAQVTENTGGLQRQVLVEESFTN